MNFRDRFGEESIEKIVEWVQDNLPLSPTPSILEIGSGNGTLLFALAEELTPIPYLCGIDYSSDAVALSQAIAAERGETADGIEFGMCNFLAEDVTIAPLNKKDSAHHWDLILDKGTLDAIALGDKDDQGRSPAWAYPFRLARLLQPGTIFLVTCELRIPNVYTRAIIHASIASLQLH
jgi:SAM-dependent methyltransferase